jgi:hypothetical protein
VRQAPLTRLWHTGIGLALLSFTTSAFAQSDQPCTVGRFCGLSGYLRGLYVIAVVLAVILVVVVIGAIVYYRKAKHARLEP